MKITIIDSKGNQKDYEIDYNKHKRERKDKVKGKELNISDIKIPND